MAHSLDDHIRCGSTHGRSMLRAIEAERGAVATKAFIEGLIEAAADHYTRLEGSQKTFNLLSDIADRQVEWLVVAATLETEMRAFVRKNFGERA